MQAKRRYRHDEAPAARSVVVEDSPSRYWGIAVIAACAASWVAIFGVAKLLLALV